MAKVVSDKRKALRRLSAKAKKARAASPPKQTLGNRPRTKSGRAKGPRTGQTKIR